MSRETDGRVTGLVVPLGESRLGAARFGRPLHEVVPALVTHAWAQQTREERTR
jgi:hypothetical protein